MFFCKKLLTLIKLARSGCAEVEEFYRKKETIDLVRKLYPGIDYKLAGLPLFS